MAKRKITIKRNPLLGSKSEAKSELEKASVNGKGHAETAKFINDDVKPVTAKRDTFTFPMFEHENIELMRKRLLKMDIELNKSEIMRLGLIALQAIDDKDLSDISDSLFKLKVGRKKIS